MTILPPEILRKILAICFPDPHPSPFSTLSTALQLSSQTLRAITLEILWTRVEFDGPLDPKTRLISRDHIRHIVRAILIKGMEKSWSTTIWRTLLSLLQSIPNLRKVFFEQIGTGTYSIDHLRKITPTQQQIDLPGWDILTFYEDQQIHTTDSFLMPWSILDRLMCTGLITRIRSLDISSNHGALEIDLMVYCIIHGTIFYQLEALTLGGLTERHITGELLWKFITTHTPALSLLKVVITPSSQPSSQLHTIVESWATCSWPPTLRHLQFPADRKNGDWPPHLLSYANVSRRTEPSHQADVLCQQMRLQNLQELQWCAADAFEVMALLDAVSYESPDIRRIVIEHTISELDENLVSPFLCLPIIHLNSSTDSSRRHSECHQENAPHTRSCHPTSSGNV
jgi:hypothetical protein